MNSSRIPCPRSLVLAAFRVSLSGAQLPKRLRAFSSGAHTPSQRVNPVGIQMLSQTLHQQLFTRKWECTPTKSAVEQSRKHLQAQGLWGKKGNSLPDISLTLPPMEGANLDQHFRTIAQQQSQPYLDLAQHLVSARLHPMPKKWSFECGWTRYDPITGHPEKVGNPDDDVLVFDVETCVTESERPVLAVAVSPRGWYSWTSWRLVSSEGDFYSTLEGRMTLDDLIPLESEPADGLRRRLVVGHHVSYDRARLKEQYLIKGPRTKFLDTLSLHACVAGQTSNQKGIWTSRKKKLAEETEEDIPSKKTSSARLWMEVSSPNNLSDVHWLHVRRGGRLDKAPRDVFVKGSVQDIRNDFQNLMRYCAEDVRCTHEVLQKVLPTFLSRCPHPVTFAGMLEMGSAYLPLDHSWSQYTADAEYTYEEMEGEMKGRLMALADNAVSFMHNKRYLSSPWLCSLDWSTKTFRGKAIKSKVAGKKLLAAIEEFYERQEMDFCGDLEEESKAEFIISSLESLVPARPVHMPGYPEWYRAVCMKRNNPHWRPGPVAITAQTRVTPYLLRMKWEGHPLHHHPKLGWGYIISPSLSKGEVPKFDSDVDLEAGAGGELDAPDITRDQMEDLLDKDLEKLSEKEVGEGKQDVGTGGLDSAKKTEGRPKKKDIELSGIDAEKGEWLPHVRDTEWGVADDVITLPNNQTFYFFKIPHKDGAGANCGNPLSKDYLPKMEDGTLTSAAGQLGHRILILNSMISFWRSARNRILQQFVVNLKSNSADSASEQCAIVPLVQVAGTITRRAVEPTWLTASNAKENRVGSELKAMVRAPPGYHLVGADVDSQELWIAAVLGDMHFTGLHGSTGVGWMTLQGSKVEGTDVHSNTARTIGISRDHAKVLNYGRIYGAGLPFIELLLRRFNPSLSGREVESKARTLYTATKGQRMYRLNWAGQKLAKEMEISVSDGGCISHEDWKFLCSGVGYMKAMSYLLDRMWVGGSESHLFNKLESIALSDLPRTPVLGCCISRALEPKYVGNSYQPSKINWVVQSSAVDYLHLMLVCVHWLFEKYDIDGRFCISIHDEVRYLVRSRDRYRAALALQLANLYTRAMFAYQLKMYDLPQSVAFFSAVDIDKVLRKEPSMDCNTPSNPLGLEKGHSIPPGEALDIYQILEKTNNSLEKNNSSSDEM